MESYDLDGARKAGLSDEQSAAYIANQVGYRYDDAVKAGVTTPQIIDFLGSHYGIKGLSSEPAAPPPMPEKKGIISRAMDTAKDAYDALTAPDEGPLMKSFNGVPMQTGSPNESQKQINALVTPPVANATGVAGPIKGPAPSWGAAAEDLASAPAQGIQRLQGATESAIGGLTQNPELVQAGARKRADANISEDLSRPKYQSDIANAAYGGARNIFEGGAIVAPTMLAGIAGAPAVGTALAAAGFGIQNAAESGANVAERGGSAGETALAGGLGGTVGAVTGAMPLSHAINKLGVDPIKKFIIDQTVNQVGMNVASSVANSAIDASIHNPDMTFEQWADTLPTQMRDSVIGGIAGATPFAALHVGAVMRQAGIERMVDDAKQKSANAFWDGISRANQTRDADMARTVSDIESAATDDDAFSAAGAAANATDPLMADVLDSAAKMRGVRPAAPGQAPEPKAPEPKAQEPQSGIIASASRPALPAPDQLPALSAPDKLPALPRPAGQPSSMVVDSAGNITPQFDTSNPYSAERNQVEIVGNTPDRSLDRGSIATPPGTPERDSSGAIIQHGQPEPEIPGQNSAPKSTFLSEVKAAGGISTDIAADILGARKDAIKQFPGLFRNNGMDQDALVEFAHQNGYLSGDENSSSQFDDVADMVRNTAAGNGPLKIRDQDVANEAKAQAIPYQQTRTLATSLGIDLRGKTWPQVDAAIDAVQRARGDQGAHEAATSPQNDLPEPTDAQKEAGNYKLGRINVGGLNISVENPEGSTRSGTDQDGRPWQTTMTGAHYGYIRGTIGKDKDHLDAFVRPGTPEDYSGPVFVVDQVDPHTGDFDEHKALIGWPDKASAQAAYRANYDQHWPGDAAVTGMGFDQFKDWAQNHEATQFPVDHEAVAERQAMMNESVPVHQDLADSLMTDDVRALSQPGEQDHIRALRALGASDDEIAALQNETQRGNPQGHGNEPGGEAPVSVARDQGQEGQAKGSNQALKESLTKEQPGEKEKLEQVPENAGTSPEMPSGYGADNKVFTAERAKAARDKLRAKLSQLNSGIDPEILSAGIELAGYHIEAGARSFAKFSKAMLDDLGEKAKPYLRAWYEAVRHWPDLEAAKEMDSPEAIERSKEPQEKPQGRLAVADAIADRLKGDGYKNINEARAHYGELTGQEIKPGTISAKKADEAVELGVVRAARSIAIGEGSDKDKYDAMVKLYDRQPNLNVRTSTSVEQQAYSTPAPLAYIADRLAGVTDKTRVYEPTAGNGMLVIGANPKLVTANELNPDRLGALTAQGIKATGNDATKNPVPPKSQDAVITNPPFGVVKDDNGKSMKWTVPSKAAPTGNYSTGEVDHAIALQALETMKDDGRAVLILGSVNKLKSGESREDAYNTGAKRDFYLSLYKGYNVVDHFTVNGDLYAKQGAGWPVDVITIAGRGPSSLPLPAVQLPRQYDSWGDLRGKLDEPFANQNGSLGADAASTGMEGGNGASPSRNANEPGLSDQSDQAARPGVGGTRGGEAGGSTGNGSGGESSGEPDRRVREVRPDGRLSGGGADAASQGARGDHLEAGDDHGAAEHDTAGLGRDDSEGLAGSGVVERKQEQETETQVHYEPFSKVGNVGTLVPVNMREAIYNSLEKLQDRVGNIDDFVTKELGYKPGELGKHLSAEQVDAVAMAIDNLKHGGGFIIGDQTGIGKGRVNAAIIRWALKNGETPIFVTQKPNLYKDMYGDLADVGSGGLKVLMTNANAEVALDDHGTMLKTPAANVWNPKLRAMIDQNHLGGHDVIFSTYDSLNTLGGDRTARMDLVEHFGKGGILILDESHSAGGGGAERGKDDDELNRGKFFRNLVGQAKAVFYSSATYAKRPDVMDLYSKTSMRDAVDDPKQLGPAIQAGGVPLQQAVAAMLARAGQMTRRERTFAGINYDTVPISVDKAMPERTAEIMRGIMAFDELKGASVQRLNKELKAEGKKMTDDGSTGGAGATSTNFTSLMHNVIAQMLLGVKVKPAADELISSIKRGERPILTLANTMESMISDFAEKHDLSSGDPVDMHFGDLLEHYLDRSREVSTKQPFQKGGDKRTLTDSELGPRALAKYNEIKAIIRGGDWSGIPISPIDYIHDQLRRAGYTSGEITGRTMGIDYGGNVPILRNRPSSEISIKGRQKILRDFNNGAVDAMILNQAGSTGLSAHASPKVGTDTRQRHMIIAQPELNIDTHMQMLGRVNRTGQINVPRYSQLAADIPSEIRPAAVLAKKMASLNANTTASRKSALTSEDTPDILNHYGDEVIASLMDGDHELHKRLGAPLKNDSENDQFSRDEAAKKVTGRIPVLPLDEQRAVYDQIVSDYKELLDQKKALGENALEAQSLPLDARTEKSVTLVPGTGESEFQGPAIANQVDVKKLGKPYTSDQVMSQVRDRLHLPDGADLERAQTVGRAHAYDQMQDVRQKFEQWRRIETMDMEDRGRETFDLRANTSMQKLQDFATTFHPGATIELVNGGGSVISGVVTNFERKGIAKNPAANGAWRMTIALADAAKQVTIPISRLTMGDEKGLTKVRPVQSDSLGTPILKLFDSGQTTLREKRTIISGNLLKAYAAVKKGQIVNYTTHDGKVEQGILMPKDFDADKERDKAAATAAAVVKTPTDGVQFLDGGARRYLVNGDGSARIIQTTSGSFKIIAPSSKKDGAAIYLNRDLRSITGDFVKVGSTMQATVPSEHLPVMIGKLIDMGGLRAVDPSRPMASRTTNDGGARPGDTLTTRGLTLMASHDELFRNEISTSRSLKDVVKTADPDIKVGQMNQGNDGSAFWNITKTADSDERNAVLVQKPDGHLVLDVAFWGQRGGGAKLYHAIANWAHNTGRVFDGDESLTEYGAVRRTEAMLSSAMKFGTTDHLDPGPRLRDGTTNGNAGGKYHTVQPMEWETGNHVKNLQTLAQAVEHNTMAHAPEWVQNARFDFNKDVFVRDDGTPISGRDFEDAAREARGSFDSSQRNGGRGSNGVGHSEGSFGSGTLQRAVLLRTLADNPKMGDGRGILAYLRLRQRVLREAAQSDVPNAGPIPRSLENIFNARGDDDIGVPLDRMRQIVENHFGAGTSDKLQAAGIRLDLKQNAPEPGVRGQAFHDEGRAEIYGNSNNEDTVIPTVYHEIGEHFGLKAMLGDEGFDKLKRDLWMARNNPWMRKAVGEVTANYPEFAGRDEGSLWNDDRFVHEVIANAGQDTAARNQSWFVRAAEAIKRFLRDKLGIGTVTPNELGHLLNGAMRKILGVRLRAQANGQEAGASERPMASRADSEELAKPPKAPTSVQDGIIKTRAADVIGRMKDVTKEAFDPLKMALDPMEMGSERAQAMVKDTANAMRYARYQWGKIDDILRKDFTPEEQERMWNAADEENNIRGEVAPDLPGMGLKSLDPKQRAVMDTLHEYGEELLQRGREAGMFEGEGVPYWSPRMAAMVGEDGAVARVPGGRPESASDGTGRNFTKSSPNLRSRKYLTTEEAEAAGKEHFGDDFAFVRNIRTMPLAMERLERAIAGRELINQIKSIGESAGEDLVGTGRDPKAFFRIDGHPAFQTQRFVKDDSGNWTRESVPLWVSREFEGPLKSLLSEKEGGIYRALMNVKGVATSAIMYSPLIHNAVVFGKAAPALPGKVITTRIYFEGAKAKTDPEIMKRAIMNGLVPIGKMGGYQDITGIAQGLGDKPGMLANSIGYAIGALSRKEVGDKVAGAIHKAGDFWHNTLLWDRVGDLQMGIYTNIERNLISKGQDPRAAGIEAAHFANLYAGAIPNEAMSNTLRKTLNAVLFSRSFTMSNLGAIQAMARGLPPDMQAQIKRDVGDLGLRAAQGSAKRKAAGMFMMDIALAMGAQALIRAGIQSMGYNTDLDDIAQGYVDRFNRLANAGAENPLSVLNPFEDLSKLGPGGDNEKGKENRILTGYDTHGTAQYLRLPFGKTAEELSGYMTNPADVLSAKESTLLRPTMQAFTNDVGFGRRLYNPDDPIVSKAGKVMWNFLSQQIPLDNIEAAGRMLAGSGEDQDATKVLGSLTGMTVSHGATGGPDVGMINDAARTKQAKISEAIPDAMGDLHRSMRLEKTDPDKADELYYSAIDKLRDAGMSPREITARLRFAQDPRGAKLAPKQMAKLLNQMSDEEAEKFAAIQRDEEQAGVR